MDASAVIDRFGETRPAATDAEYHDHWRRWIHVSRTMQSSSTGVGVMAVLIKVFDLSGSWVVRHLTLMYRHHYNVVCFDKLDYCASLNNIAQLDGESNFSFYKGDVTNSSDVMDCLRKHDIDTVLHFAAQSHVDLSYGHSYQFTLTNVFGTEVLLECAKQHGKICRFIHVSTDEVYGETKVGQDDLVEESPLAPTNPYAASKAAAEMLVHAYSKSFQLPTIVVRSNNVYGPR